MFVAYRQFASAVGAEEIKEVHVRLPVDSIIAPDGTEVYPARVWTKNNRLKILRPNPRAAPGRTVEIRGDP